jgi:hypothetical protein
LERETGHLADATAITQHHFCHRSPENDSTSNNADAARRLDRQQTWPGIDDPISSPRPAR